MQDADGASDTLRVYAGLGCSERSRSLSRPVGCSCGLALGDSVQRTQDASGMQWTARWRNRGVLDGSEQTRVCVCACVVCVCGVRVWCVWFVCSDRQQVQRVRSVRMMNHNCRRELSLFIKIFPFQLACPLWLLQLFVRPRVCQVHGVILHLP